MNAVTDNLARRSRWSGRWNGLLTLLFAVLSIVPQAAFSARLSTAREYQLKALFVYNFTKFIEWPELSFSSAEAPIVIGVLGDCPLGAHLAEVVKDRAVNGRSIIVTRIEDASQAQSAHVLFVSAQQLGLFDQIRAAIQYSPVLTVGESRSFALRDGTINFVMEDDIPRFEINMGPAERAGLKISAQLQKLAKMVFTES